MFFNNEKFRNSADDGRSQKNSTCQLSNSELKTLKKELFILSKSFNISKNEIRDAIEINKKALKDYDNLQKYIALLSKSL